MAGWIAVGFFVCHQAGLAELVVPTDSRIHYQGRWNRINPSVPWAYWAGASIQIAFDGTGLAIDLEAASLTEHYRVVLDGIAQSDRLLVTGREVNVLASGLPSGRHVLQVMKETTNAGKTYFHGLEVTGGGLAEPPSRPPLRIEFYGDSNASGRSTYSEKNAAAMGTYYVFPAMVSRMLGAEMHLQAFSGANLLNLRDYIYSEDRVTVDPSYRSGFDPHLIIVNGGANDLAAGKTGIKNRYKAVISDLRTVYGDAPHIVLFNGYGWNVNEPAGFTQEVVDEVGGNLSACVHSWLWEQWHGCQWDHSGQAHQLVDHLAAINPAWAPITANDIIDGFGREFNVANGSFEHSAPFGGFGWRYRLDGVARIQDPADAADGAHFIRLNAGEDVHQPIDATGDGLPGGTTDDQVYYVYAMVRGDSSGAVARIGADFEGQQFMNRANRSTHTFAVTADWQPYSTTFTAPIGSWKTFLILGAQDGTVDFDDVRMGNRPTLYGASMVPSALRLWWQSAPGKSYQLHFTDTFDQWTALRTVIGNGGILEEVVDTSRAARRYYRVQTRE